MKMKNDKKENLEKDVCSLNKKIESLGGDSDILDFSYEDYKSLKSGYKKDKVQNFKVKSVRNLKITNNIIRIAIPIVLIIGSFPGCFMALNSMTGYHNYDENYNQYNIVYMDSTGKTKEQLQKKEYDDYIKIDTRWFEENEVYVQYEYKANHDFKTVEEIENVVNSDYFDLLQKYDFKEEKKLVAEKNDKRVIDKNAKDIIKVNAGVTCTREEYEEVSKLKVGDYIIDGLIAAVISGITTIFILANHDFDKLKSNIKFYKSEANKKIIGDKSLKEKKVKLKQIKKRFK